MSSRMMPSELASKLSPLVEREGIAPVLDALGLICHERAQQLDQITGDPRLGDPWRRAAFHIDHAAVVVEV